MITKFKKMSKKWTLLSVLVIGLIAAVALTNATNSSKDDADIHGDTPMMWVGYAEGHEASNPPQGYGGYGGNPGGDGDSTKGSPVFYGVSTEGSVPMGYGGYALGYGGSKDNEEDNSDIRDGNSPSDTP